MRVVNCVILPQVALLASYPLSSHFAITLDEPYLQLLALVLLGLGLNLQGLLNGKKSSWLLMLAVVAVSSVVSHLALAHWLLYLPPVILPLLMWNIFFVSLSDAQGALITRIATSVHGELSLELKSYTRHITLLWSCLFLGIAMFSAVLPFIATPEIWSLFTNLLNWAIIAAFFIIEFIYRQFRFKQIEHPNLWQYLQIVVRSDIRKIG